MIFVSGLISEISCFSLIKKLLKHGALSDFTRFSSSRVEIIPKLVTNKKIYFHIEIYTLHGTTILLYIIVLLYIYILLYIYFIVYEYC